MVAPAPGEFFLVAQDLLDCASAALATTAAGVPDRVCMYPGQEPTWDNCDCGLLAVHVPRNYASESFPDQKVRGTFRPGACGTPWTVAEYVVTVLRCTPANDDQGNPPSCEALAQSMETQLADRQAVLWGVLCCLGERPYLLGEQLALGDNGACAGSELHVFVPFSNCHPCPPEGF
jgi:hypothetical protein